MVLKMGGRCSGGAKFASGNGVWLCGVWARGIKGGMMEGWGRGGSKVGGRSRLRKEGT